MTIGELSAVATLAGFVGGFIAGLIAAAEYLRGESE